MHRRTRPGKPDENGIDSLSERELELARLVVDRKTNPEIAAALFLSQKTVERTYGTCSASSASAHASSWHARSSGDRRESAR